VRQPHDDESHGGEERRAWLERYAEAVRQAADVVTEAHDAYNRSLLDDLNSLHRGDHDGACPQPLERFDRSRRARRHAADARAAAYVYRIEAKAA
jgi:hypothetical protein